MLKIQSLKNKIGDSRLYYLLPLVSQTFGDIDEDVVVSMFKALPMATRTENRRALHWLRNLYRRGKWKVGDVDETRDVLSKFFIEHRERKLTDFASVPDLYAYLRALDNVSLDEESVPRFEKIYDHDGWLCVVPLNEMASNKYGAETRWCTVSDSEHSMFHHYNDKGELIIIIDRVNNRKWQFHYATSQFMDAQDHPVKWEEVSFPSEVEECIAKRLGLPLQFYKYDFLKEVGENLWTIGWYIVDFYGKRIGKWKDSVKYVRFDEPLILDDIVDWFPVKES